ncbi:MAG TPA: NarK family nitrate/nitrite MFS transporter [Nitriliruptorales bacterium]|nr:NarK family nitrate/nitrite MFS transporter [Nitriliruptorales bacterium]
MSRWIEQWDPDDREFWESQGRTIARRNLVCSIFVEFMGFAVWLIWSVLAIKLPEAGFDLSKGQLFTLVAVPSLVGATMRFPYTVAVPLFGGRNWTVISGALLLIPTGLIVVTVTDPTTPYGMLLLVAATAGLGGGNFASSMSHISFFFPKEKKGLALGLNAAGGNIGVGFVQLVIPLAVGLEVVNRSDASAVHLENAGLLFIPLIVAASLCAWLFMDNLRVSRSKLRDLAPILRRTHTWVMSWLYIGTFGSFIGYSAALPLLIRTEFATVNPAHFAFIGPLVGSLVRPVGGWLADRLGGARVSFWSFLAMIGAVLGVVYCLSHKAQPFAFAGFLTMFLVLFVTTGIGNGSTFRMIPLIFRSQHLRLAAGRGLVSRQGAEAAGAREAAAVLGFTSAVGAYGGFVVPQTYGISIANTGTVLTALAAFVVFYLSCVALTWWFYLRRSFALGRFPSLADANV